MDWGWWVFLWVREMCVGKWVEPVKVIMKVISSVPVTFRVHFLKSRVASVHLWPLLTRPDRPFGRQWNLPFLTQPSATGEAEPAVGEGLLHAHHGAHWQEPACREEDRELKTTASLKHFLISSN